MRFLINFADKKRKSYLPVTVLQYLFLITGNPIKQYLQIQIIYRKLLL